MLRSQIVTDDTVFDFVLLLETRCTTSMVVKVSQMAPMTDIMSAILELVAAIADSLARIDFSIRFSTPT